jgi:hypothetical protein
MIVFAVAFAVTALVLAVIVVGTKFRDSAFCPRRESLVKIVDGQCEYRISGLCVNAPLGCERECIELSGFGVRAG